MGRREDIQARMRALESEQAQLDRYGEDIYDDGDVIKFVKTYRRRKPPTVYTASQHYETWDATYVALKMNGHWYLTGKKGAEDLNGCGWDTLVEFMYTGIPTQELKISIAENFLTREELETQLAALGEAIKDLDIRDSQHVRWNVPSARTMRRDAKQTMFAERDVPGEPDDDVDSRSVKNDGDDVRANEE